MLASSSKELFSSVCLLMSGDTWFMPGPRTPYLWPSMQKRSIKAKSPLPKTISPLPLMSALFLPSKVLLFPVPTVLPLLVLATAVLQSHLPPPTVTRLACAGITGTSLNKSRSADLLVPGQETKWLAGGQLFPYLPVLQAPL